MAEKMDDEISECSTINTDRDNEECDELEVEVVFSETVSLSSCNTKQEYASCPSIHSSYPDINETTKDESNSEEKTSKARKFKNIALPNWLVKPHAKKSSEEGVFSKHFHGFHGNKRKMLRANSAPKKLISGGVKMERQHCKTIAEGVEDGSSQSGDPSSKSKPPFFPNFPAIQITEEGKEKHKGHHKFRRRASLPAQVGKRFVDSANKGCSTDSNNTSINHAPLTPETGRRKLSCVDQLEKDVLKTLIFGRPLPGIAKDPTLHPEPLTTENKVDDNNNNSDMKNTNNDLQQESTKPRLQLHRLEPPDLFYVPDFEEETETAVHLDRKVSVSAGELHTATKIDNDKLEVELIKTLIGQDLRNYLEDKTFIADLCQKWCAEISQNIQNSVQNFKGDQYKVVVVVYIAALRDKGIHAAVQCLWTPDQDCFATAAYKNESLYALAALMAIKYD